MCKIVCRCVVFWAESPGCHQVCTGDNGSNRLEAPSKVKTPSHLGSYSVFVISLTSVRATASIRVNLSPVQECVCSPECIVSSQPVCQWKFPKLIYNLGFGAG